MKQTFIPRTIASETQDARKIVLLFFSGWASDPSLFEGNETPYDVICCTDYRTIYDFDDTLLHAYDDIHVVAWSFGVWVASRCLASTSLPIRSAIAFNGTPFPVDATRGIATAIFEGTLAGLTERSLTKFQRRMCGSCLAAFQERLSPRPFLEIREELALLGDAFQAGIDVRFCWTKAYVGSRDLIFSPEAQYAAWEQLGVPTETVDAAHYDTDFIARLWRNDL